MSGNCLHENLTHPNWIYIRRFSPEGTWFYVWVFTNFQGTCHNRLFLNWLRVLSLLQFSQELNLGGHSWYDWKCMVHTCEAVPATLMPLLREKKIFKVTVGCFLLFWFLILHSSKYLPPNMWQNVGRGREFTEGRKLDVKNHQKF